MKEKNSEILKGLFEAAKLKPEFSLSLYSEPFLSQRLDHYAKKWNLTPAEAIYKITVEAQYLEDFHSGLSINVSNFFRDKKLYTHLGHYILDWLKTFQKINVWSVGCSMGEEPISLAIWLEANGLLERSTIYATDSSTEIIKKAKEANYSSETIAHGAKNCPMSIGPESFLAFFRDNKPINNLSKHISYFKHSAIYDKSYAQMQLIYCANMMIYYNKEGQHKILSLLKESSMKGTYLALGSSELIESQSLTYFNIKKIDCPSRLYRFA